MAVAVMGPFEEAAVVTTSPQLGTYLGSGTLRTLKDLVANTGTRGVNDAQCGLGFKNAIWLGSKWSTFSVGVPLKQGCRKPGLHNPTRCSDPPGCRFLPPRGQKPWLDRGSEGLEFSTPLP